MSNAKLQDTDVLQQSPVTQVIYRAAREEDCPALAKLYSETFTEFDGMSAGLPNTHPPYQQQLWALTHEGPYHYSKATVAELAGEIIGSVSGMPCSEMQSYEDLLKFLPEERIWFLKETFADLPSDSYFCDKVVVTPHAGGKWVGPRLCSAFVKKVKEEGWDKLYFYVWGHNEQQQKMYTGRYRAVCLETVAIPENDILPPEITENHLMCVDLKGK